uniref:Uncharacterized protein n=1 Tax=Cacopsylla melanoneura TaxID=428564 RepID=A0A8D8ZD89_9HEMI
MYIFVRTIFSPCFSFMHVHFHFYLTDFFSLFSPVLVSSFSLLHVSLFECALLAPCVLAISLSLLVSNLINSIQTPFFSSLNACLLGFLSSWVCYRSKPISKPTGQTL